MRFVEFVEEQKKLARLANIEEVRKDIKKAWVQTKIKNHVINFSGLFSKEELEEKILTDLIVASKFCKDPSKQNISEKLAIEFLGVEKLPAKGPDSIRFSDSGEIVSTVLGSTKSADFQWGEYYATQKFTQEAGGAQDNQKNDVIDFLKRGSIKYKVMAVLDGYYWDRYRDDLKLLFKSNPNVIITSVDELKSKQIDLF